jgi:hypothetical protein
MTVTFSNSATVLSMGLFFTIVTLGLASKLPAQLYNGLAAAGVNSSAAHQAANAPPISSLFSAFLGYNPVHQLLSPTGALQQLQPQQLANVTSRSFFPALIEQPFAYGLHLALTCATIATAIAIAACALMGRRYIHAEEPASDVQFASPGAPGGLGSDAAPVAPAVVTSMHAMDEPF